MSGISDYLLNDADLQIYTIEEKIQYERDVQL